MAREKEFIRRFLDYSFNALHDDGGHWVRQQDDGTYIPAEEEHEGFHIINSGGLDDLMELHNMALQITKDVVILEIVTDEDSETLYRKMQED